TGRSPKDKAVVREPGSEAHVWWGAVNRPFDAGQYAALRAEVLEHLAERDLFVMDVHAGADPKYRLNVRSISPNAWQSLFVHNMFREPTAADREAFEPGFTILHAPEFEAEPARHGTRSSTFVILNFATREVMIGGTRYAGEMKKSIFSVLNYLLPAEG